LKDQEGYNGELYMNDLVEDAKKWVSIMEKEKPDIIVAVAHTGGNRVVLEITENDKINEDFIEKKKAYIDHWNIEIALDDFGTGYN
ncbi:hypothetical protein ACTPEF_25235, partial [Clostridioides difficile]